MRKIPEVFIKKSINFDNKNQAQSGDRSNKVQAFLMKINKIKHFFRIYAKLMNRRKTDNLLSKQKTNVGRLTTSSFLSPNPKSTKSSNDLRKSSNEISRTTDINVKTNESFRYNNDLSKSYDSFYKNAFEEKGASSAGVKEMFVSQMIDERSQFRMTLTPFLSNSARNFSFFAKSMHFF